jgi:hypothetical protein
MSRYFKSSCGDRSGRIAGAGVGVLRANFCGCSDFDEEEYGYCCAYLLLMVCYISCTVGES